MLGKIGDHAVILVAAILTICGVALALLPWGALTPPAPPAPKTPKAIVFVDMGQAAKDNPQSDGASK